MKRLIAAVSFAALAVPAFAAGLPYSQNQVDGALPNVSKALGDAPTSRFGVPYDQIMVDRALPNVDEHRSSSSGNTADRGSAAPVSPWANDYHFIAPAQ